MHLAAGAPRRRVRLVVDTSVAIAMLAQRQSVIERLSDIALEELGRSVVVIGKLLFGAQGKISVRAWVPDERRRSRKRGVRDATAPEIALPRHSLGG